MTGLELLDSIVPISDFNRGKASAAFNRVSDGKPVVVMKHNVPTYVVLTTDDYRRALEIEADFELYQMAVERMKTFNPKDAISREELLSEYGISDEELDALPEAEFE